MEQLSSTLQGKRIAIVGRLAGMSRRELVPLLRQYGAVVLEKAGPEVDIIVLGEAGSGGPVEQIRLEEDIQESLAAGQIELVRETQLWHRLGLVDSEMHRFYTPAMLAELLRVPVAVVRRWYRRGLLRASRLVRKLPYFDFQEVTVARRLAELYSAGATQQAIERQMADLRHSAPEVSRPLSQLPVRIEGKWILLRREDGLMEPSGQLRFDFESVPTPEVAGESRGGSFSAETSLAPVSWEEAIQAWGGDSPPYYTPEELLQMAAELDEAGRLREAAEMLRAAMAAAGPSAEMCFQLADLLYRLGDLSAARERYYIAIELDENFVEARNNLGCLLAETGELELALAALEGALAYHPHYADAHYHLARLLDELGQPQEAELHWRNFLALAPESPWVEQARSRLNEPHP